MSLAHARSEYGKVLRYQQTVTAEAARARDAFVLHRDRVFPSSVSTEGLDARPKLEGVALFSELVAPIKRALGEDFAPLLPFYAQVEALDLVLNEVSADVSNRLLKGSFAPVTEALLAMDANRLSLMEGTSRLVGDISTPQENLEAFFGMLDLAKEPLARFINTAETLRNGSIGLAAGDLARVSMEGQTGRTFNIILTYEAHASCLREVLGEFTSVFDSARGTYKTGEVGTQLSAMNESIERINAFLHSVDEYVSSATALFTQINSVAQAHVALATGVGEFLKSLNAAIDYSQPQVNARDDDIVLFDLDELSGDSVPVVSRLTREDDDGIIDIAGIWGNSLTPKSAPGEVSVEEAESKVLAPVAPVRVGPEAVEEEPEELGARAPAEVETPAEKAYDLARAVEQLTELVDSDPAGARAIIAEIKANSNGSTDVSVIELLETVNAIAQVLETEA